MKKATGKTRLQQQAIIALLASPTVKEAAERCGVTGRTLQTWLAQPAFMGLYRSARKELVDGAFNRLRIASLRAVETLDSVASDTAAPAAARVSAARGVLELVLKAGEIDLEDRLAEVERLVQDGGF